MKTHVCKMKFLKCPKNCESDFVVVGFEMYGVVTFIQL